MTSLDTIDIINLALVPVPPMMTVPSQLEGVRLGSNVTLRCKSEAFPASINYWVRGQRAETVTSGPRLRSYSLVQDHVTHMKLEIVRSVVIMSVFMIILIFKSFVDGADYYNTFKFIAHL